RAYRWYFAASENITGMKRIRAEAQLKRIVAGDPGASLAENSATDPAANPKPQSNKPPLIVKARWGGGNNWSDVTKRVREAVASGATVSATLGLLIVDPTPGWRKHLEITCEQNGQRKAVSIDEGQNWTRDDGAAK